MFTAYLLIIKIILMITSDPRSKILFISTFPPVKCGIASFTQDLIHSIVPEIKDNYLINVCALDKKGINASYKFPVTMVMNSYDLDSCIETAERINKDNAIELVCIEHEFGLYGGELGSFLLGFLTILEKPFIIRFHTVLPSPDTNRLKLVKS